MPPPGESAVISPDTQSSAQPDVVNALKEEAAKNPSTTVDTVIATLSPSAKAKWDEAGRTLGSTYTLAQAAMESAMGAANPLLAGEGATKITKDAITAIQKAGIDTSEAPLVDLMRRYAEETYGQESVPPRDLDPKSNLPIGQQLRQEVGYVADVLKRSKSGMYASEVLRSFVQRTPGPAYENAAVVVKQEQKQQETKEQAAKKEAEDKRATEERIRVEKQEETDRTAHLEEARRAEEQRIQEEQQRLAQEQAQLTKQKEEEAAQTFAESRQEIADGNVQAAVETLDRMNSDRTAPPGQIINELVDLLEKNPTNSAALETLQRALYRRGNSGDTEAAQRLFKEIRIAQQKEHETATPDAVALAEETIVRDGWPDDPDPIDTPPPAGIRPLTEDEENMRLATATELDNGEITLDIQEWYKYLGADGAILDEVSPIPGVDTLLSDTPPAPPPPDATLAGPAAAEPQAPAAPTSVAERRRTAGETAATPEEAIQRAIGELRPGGRSIAPAHTVLEYYVSAHPDQLDALQNQLQIAATSTPDTARKIFFENAIQLAPTWIRSKNPPEDAVTPADVIPPLSEQEQQIAAIAGRFLRNKGETITRLEDFALAHPNARQRVIETLTQISDRTGPNRTGPNETPRNITREAIQNVLFRLQQQEETAAPAPNPPEEPRFSEDEAQHDLAATTDALLALAPSESFDQDMDTWRDLVGDDTGLSAEAAAELESKLNGVISAPNAEPPASSAKPPLGPPAASISNEELQQGLAGINSQTPQVENGTPGPENEDFAKAQTAIERGQQQIAALDLNIFLFDHPEQADRVVELLERVATLSPGLIAIQNRAAELVAHPTTKDVAHATDLEKEGKSLAVVFDIYDSALDNPANAEAIEREMNRIILEKPEWAQQAYLTLWSLYMGQNRLDEASQINKRLKILEEAQEPSPADRADALLAEGNLTGALNEYDAMLNEPTNTNMQLTAGLAIPQLRTILDREPNSSQAMNVLALALEKTGDPKDQKEANNLKARAQESTA